MEPGGVGVDGDGQAQRPNILDEERLVVIHVAAGQPLRDTFEIPLQGMLLIEAPKDTPFTAVAVKGALTVGWLVTGQQA